MRNETTLRGKSKKFQLGESELELENVALKKSNTRHGGEVFFIKGQHDTFQGLAENMKILLSFLGCVRFKY